MALLPRPGGGRRAAGLWADLAADGQVHPGAAAAAAEWRPDRRPDPAADDTGRRGAVSEEYEPVHGDPGAAADHGGRDPGERARHSRHDALQTAPALDVPGG